MSNDEVTSTWTSIPGGAEAFEQVGGSFHDAEVRKLHLNRKEPSVLEIEKPLVDGRKLVVTFILGDWIDVDVRGFSHQNVMGDLNLRRAGEREVAVWELGVGLRPGEVEIELEPCFGAYGIIRATVTSIAVEVLAAEPST
jgi:hypothetical protein